MSRSLRLSPVLLLCCLLVNSPASAQVRVTPDPAPDWVGEFTALSANALIGGVTAGVARKLGGGSFSEGFSKGFVGGGLVYAGKRIAVARFDGAGLIGRDVAAVGSSIVANVSRGDEALSQIVMPLGPVRFHIDRGDRFSVTPRLDLVTTAATIYYASVPELEWDISRSFSSGVPVFRAPGKVLGTDVDDTGRRADALGLARAGVIVLSDIEGIDTRQTFAHERVHVIQFDQIFQQWTAPAERWLLRRLPIRESLTRYVDVNASPLVTTGLRAFFADHDARPWEIEANFLMDR